MLRVVTKAVLFWGYIAAFVSGSRFFFFFLFFSFLFFSFLGLLLFSFFSFLGQKIGIGMHMGMV